MLRRVKFRLGITPGVLIDNAIIPICFPNTAFILVKEIFDGSVCGTMRPVERDSEGIGSGIFSVPYVRRSCQ